MELRGLVFFFIANYLAFAASLDPNLIINYFKFKKITSGSLYGCNKIKDQMVLGKVLMKNGLSLKTFDLNELGSYEVQRIDLSMTMNGHLGVILDGDCPDSDIFLQQASELKVFTEVQHWLVLLTGNSIDRMFANLSLTIQSDVLVAVSGQVTPNLNIFEVYNPASEHGGRLVYRWYQILHKGQQFRPRVANLYWQRRNLTGVTFKAMVLLPRPFSGTLEDYLVYDGERGLNTIYRYHTHLMYHVQDFYNFSMKFSVTQSWGFKMPNGTFDGLVGALETRQVDFGCSPLFVKIERWPVIDYGRRTFLLKNPKRPASFEVFLRPLDGTIWYLTLLTLILIIVVFRLTIFTEFKYLKDFVTRQCEASWSLLALTTIGALCQQGASDSPDSIPGRIIFLFTFLFAILLYQFYSASVVSSLLMAPAKFIKNLYDLAHSNLKLGCEDILYSKDYIKKMQHDPVVSLLKHKALRKKNLSFYMDPEVGLPLVAKGGFAYHVDFVTAYPIIQKTFDDDVICSLEGIQLFPQPHMNQPLQKGSPFRDMLNHILHKTDEYGLMKRQLAYWDTDKPACLKSQFQTSSVAIEEFYPALSILLIGIVFSLMILVFEIAAKLREEKREEERVKRRIKRKIRPLVN